MIVILLGLFYFSVVGVLRANEISLSSPKSFFSASYLYVSWVSGVVVDLWDIGTETLRMTGNVVRQGFNETKR